MDAELEAKKEVFLIYVAAVELQKINVRPAKRAKIACFLVEKVLGNVLDKHTNHINMISTKAVAELSDYFGINNYPINLKDGKESL